MKYQHIISIIIAAMLFACNNSGNVEKIDFAKEYPDADAVYITMTKEYVLNNDGSIDYTYSHRQKILTHFAFNRRYGESFIIYNPEKQTLKINKSETEMANGTIVPSPNNAFNEVLPHEAIDAPAYNHLREMVVTHTGLETGATINFSYTLHSNKDYFPAFTAYEILNMNSPIKKLNVIIKVPEKTKLNFASLNCDIQLLESVENGQKIYSFTLNDIPAKTRETHIANKSKPSFIFSTKSFADIHKTFTSQDAFKFNTSESINKYITANPIKKLDIKNALNIEKYIADNINTYHLSLHNTACKLRTPAEVWKSNGGTEIEKTILLTAILKKYGYDASPVAICENYLYNNKIGVPDIFSGFAVRIKLEDGFHYLSATHNNAQNLIFNIGKYSLLNLETYNEQLIIDKETPNNELKINGDFSISTDKLISADIQSYFSGECNTYYKLIKNKDAAKKLLSGIDIYKSNIENTNNNYSKINFEIKNTDIFKKQANYYFWQLPFATTGINKWHLYFLSSNRTAGFETPHTIKEEYEYKIMLPENLKLVTLPADINKTTSSGMVQINIKQKDNILKIYRKIEINNTITDTTNYKAFRDMINLWNNKKYTEIIFKEI